MIREANCHKRRCRHYEGLKRDGEPEGNERHVCAAFPDGIPESIAFGFDLHMSPVPGDNGIRYEPEPQPTVRPTA